MEGEVPTYLVISMTNIINCLFKDIVGNMRSNFTQDASTEDTGIFGPEEGFLVLVQAIARTNRM